MTHLVKLDADRNNGIKFDILFADYNLRITNVNHMTKLVKLHAYDNCGINNKGI
jgi:hypothetical protein